MVIERRIKYISFHWDDDTQELLITTFYRGNLSESASEEERPITGAIKLNKTYLFSTMRFMIRCMQRMGRGFPAWVKKRKNI